jgi:hypothetical protein
MRDETSSSSQEFIEDDGSAEPIEHNEYTLVENPEEDNNDAPRKSKRQRTVKSFGDDFIVYLINDTPRTIEEAYSSPDTDYWKEAVRSEMDSLYLMEPGRSLNVLMDVNRLDASGCSRKILGQIVLLKSSRLGLWPRVIPKKKENIYLILIHQLISLTTIRVLLSLTASYGLLVHQMDVKTAFLNGEVEEEIYMDRPDGFVSKGQEGMVCKLLKSLYGLK